MERSYIKIGRWYLPINGVTFHIFDNTVEVFQLGSTKLLFTYDGEQAKRIRQWLEANTEDISEENVLD